jgi:hypothetical protein
VKSSYGVVSSYQWQWALKIKREGLVVGLAVTRAASPRLTPPGGGGSAHCSASRICCSSARAVYTQLGGVGDPIKGTLVV